MVGDHRRIGILAAEHNLERGFRHFAWHANDTDPPAELRWKGFVEALARERFVPERWIWRPGVRRPSDLWRAKCEWLIGQLQAIPKIETGLPIVDIAAQAGYQTPQYLNHVFHKATGVTPRKFRLLHPSGPPRP